MHGRERSLENYYFNHVNANCWDFHLVTTFFDQAEMLYFVLTQKFSILITYRLLNKGVIGNVIEL